MQNDHAHYRNRGSLLRILFHDGFEIYEYGLEIYSKYKLYNHSMKQNQW